MEPRFKLQTQNHPRGSATLIVRILSPACLVGRQAGRRKVQSPGCNIGQIIISRLHLVKSLHAPRNIWFHEDLSKLLPTGRFNSSRRFAPPLTSLKEMQRQLSFVARTLWTQIWKICVHFEWIVAIYFVCHRANYSLRRLVSVQDWDDRSPALIVN